MATPEELAYLAGVIDSDGSIGYYRTRASKCHPWATAKIGVSIVQAEPAAADLARQLFGGHLGIRKPQIDNRGINSKKPLWHWMVTHRKAVVVLEALLPYLRIKKARAAYALRIHLVLGDGRRWAQQTDRRAAFVEAFHRGIRGLHRHWVGKVPEQLSSIHPADRHTVRPVCSVSGCSGHAIARGWCGAHYATWRRNGDPTVRQSQGRPRRQEVADAP